MKSLLLLICTVCLLVSGPVSQADAFTGMKIEELTTKAEEGDPIAQTKLGVAYARGTGVDIDKKKAAELYQKAADQGLANAQWNLAFAYVRGDGVEEDFAKALELFTLAAEQGYAQAEYDLGMMYLQGIGVEPDRTKAIAWIQKSADHGYKNAHELLDELNGNESEDKNI